MYIRTYHTVRVVTTLAAHQVVVELIYACKTAKPGIMHHRCRYVCTKGTFTHLQYSIRTHNTESSMLVCKYMHAYVRIRTYVDTHTAYTCCT